jgi:N-carbamoyl-L-amino-acid hydrolase
VPNGGRLDGARPVTAALEVTHAASTPPVTLKLVDWADEKGPVRPQSAGIVRGGRKPVDRRRRDPKDRQGTTLVEALAENGVALERMLDAHRELKAIDARLPRAAHRTGTGARVARTDRGRHRHLGVERNMLRFVGQAALGVDADSDEARRLSGRRADRARMPRFAIRHSKPGAAWSAPSVS